MRRVAWAVALGIVLGGCGSSGGGGPDSAGGGDSSTGADAAALDGATAPADTATDSAATTPDDGPLACSSHSDCSSLTVSECSRGRCNITSGTCFLFVADGGEPCDDADPCTGDDRCRTGACRGTPLPDATCIYDESPDLASCSPGSLSQAAKDEAVDRINELRALHGLRPVTYNAANDAANQQGALMLAANGELSHEPPASWACFSAPGANALKNSNLHMRFSDLGVRLQTMSFAVDSWVNDDGVRSGGHRRWILDPFVTEVGLGSAHGEPAVTTDFDVAQAMVLRINDGPEVPPGDDAPEFIAWPFGDYPASLYTAEADLSLSVLADTARRFGANQSVDYSGATVTMSGPDGAVAVADVSHDNEGFGLPNYLRFRAGALEEGVEYTVRVEGVAVARAPRTISWTFRLVP